MANEQKTIISTKNSRAAAENQSALDFTVNEMIGLKSDPDMQDLQNSSLGKKEWKFKSLVWTNGKWDFKPILRKKISLYRHKTIISEVSKRSAPVYATEIQGDDEYLYDYDIWSNFSYGYAGRMAGIHEDALWTFSKGHDIGSGIKRDIANIEKNGLSFKNTLAGFMDAEDTAAVQLGIDLFDKYGDSLSKYQLEKALVKMMIERKDQLRKYQKNDLRIDGVRVRENDTLESIAEEMGVPLGAIMVKNPGIKDPNNFKIGTAIIIPSDDEVEAYEDTIVKGLKNSNGIKELQGDGDEVEPKPADKGASDDEVSAFSDVPNDEINNENIAETEAETEEFLRMIQKDVSNEKNPIKRREGRDNLSKLYSLLYGDDEVEYEMGKVIHPKIKNTPAQLLAKIKKAMPTITRNAYETNRAERREPGTGRNAYEVDRAEPREPTITRNAYETNRAEPREPSLTRNAYEVGRAEPREPTITRNAYESLSEGEWGDIAGLQRGLNMLNNYSTNNPDPDKRPLKEDGIFGVKTNKALQKAIEEKEEEEIKKAYQMGKFWRF